MNNKTEQEVINIIKLIEEDNKKKLIISFFKKTLVKFLKKVNKLERNIKDNSIPLEKACNVYFMYHKNLLKEIKKIEKSFNERIILKKIKGLFRNQIKDYATKSIIINRAFNKPFGYPGDYETIEIFYDNKPLSKGIGYCGDKYILQDEYVEAVRARKEMMRKFLYNFIENSPKESLNITNLGCGSCREMRDLFSDFNSDKQLNFNLVDWEAKVFRFVREIFNKYKGNKKIRIKFIKENVFNFYKYPERYTKIFKKQDLIYSIGLVDYLPDLILGQILKFCFALLKNDGVLMIAHKNVKVRQSIVSDWFSNWSFYPRDKKDIKMIIKECLKGCKFRVRIIEERTKHIFFVIVNKL